MTLLKMKISDKIKYHYDNKKYCKVVREVGKNSLEKSYGFIVDHSENFILLQQINDFEIDGFEIFPIKSISKILYSHNDRYYNKILCFGGITDKIENKHEFDLSSWKTILTSIK